MRKDLLQILFSLRRFGLKPGLERIQKILQEVGNPQNKIRTIHIAGTNGKGSVACLLASIYKEAGFKVGLYTSPHIYSFNERIRINGIPIPDSDLEDLVVKYIKFAETLNATFFEITTAIAFDYFANSGTEICVIETGMGGRFDATNVLYPLLSIITKIDIDHEEYLGKSIKEITFEKAGIIKPGSKCIISFNDPLVYDIIKDLKGKETELILTQLYAKGEIIEFKPHTMKLEVQTDKSKYIINSPLIGEYQLENILASIVSVETLCKEYRIDENAICNGIQNVIDNAGLYGRFELLRKDPPFIIDVAHNPDSIFQTVKLMQKLYPRTKWNIVFASMKDKNYSEMLKKLIPISNSFILPNLQYDRAEKNITLKKILEEIRANCDLRFEKLILTDTTTQAFDYVIKIKEPTLVIGSFYLISELVEKFIEELNWQFQLHSKQIKI